MISDYLQCGRLIVERLKATTVGTFRTIAGESSLENLTNYSDFAPAALVIYANDSSAEAEKRGGATIISQTWLVACMFPNYDAQFANSGENARIDAGPALSNVVKHLHGWKPSKDYQVLNFVGDRRFVDEDEHVIWALGFEARFGHCPDVSMRIAC